MALLTSSAIFRVIVFVHCVRSFVFPNRRPTWPARVNVALHKSCNMTSYYTGDFRNGCGAAINNNRGRAYTKGNCIHTDHGDVHPRWTVDLGQEYVLQEVDVYLRHYSSRYSNISIYIDNRSVYHKSAGGTIVLPHHSGAAVRTGRFVTIGRDGYGSDQDSYLLNVCEVQVFATVCQTGKYPLNGRCQHCGQCANHQQCNNSTGDCPHGCQPGYQPPICATEIDECATHPCQHGGLCHDFLNMYSCTCVQGYAGHNCETDIDECASHPCQNGGSCTDSLNRYSCRCLPGYKGHNCETDIDECASRPCQNGGTCKDQINAYSCSCQPGYTGEICQRVCDSLHYGPGCGSQCSAGCGGNATCDRVNGACTAPVCRPGYKQTAKCDQSCDQHSYGVNCTEHCSAGCRDENCRAEDGECTTTECLPGYKQTPRCNQECDPHQYGDNCSMECSAGCGGRECTPQTGHCTNSTCLPGYQQSPLCDHKCTEGTYGRNCSSICGSGCISVANCNTVDGTCACKTNWKSGICSMCARGHYGPDTDCGGTCGNGCQEDSCDADNGQCQCTEGWEPPFCSECAEGYYGSDCDLQCGHCADNATCDKTDGHCPGSCDGPYLPPLCQTPCENGTYGQNCNQTCGHCKDDGACDIDSGHCPSCLPGWVPPLCQQQCEAGQYGQNCNEECGHCNASRCDPANGHCPLGACEDGFTGDLCKQCQPCLWGDNCSLPCGQCGGDRSCDMATGQCIAGQCLPGWNGTQCLQQLPETSSDPASAMTLIAAVVSVAAVATIVIVVVVVVIRRQRRRSSRKSHQDGRNGDNIHEEVTISEIGGQDGSETAGPRPQVAVKPRPVHGQNGSLSADLVYQNIDTTTLSSESALPSDDSLNPQSAPKTKGDPTAQSDALRDNRPKVANKPSTPPRSPVYQNVDQVFTGSSQKHDTSSSPRTSDTAMAPKGLKRNPAEEETPEEEERDVYNNEDLYACYRSLNSLSMIDSFQKYLLDCLASPEKLSKEFKVFPKGMPHPHEVGSDPANNKKNRFKMLCAYDKNRVILKRPAGDTNTDYINASYIKGYQKEKAYIATQGPRDHMISDLWWMVWQEKAAQIIMLTNLVEDGKDKCSQYWPEPGTTTIYGHLTVTTLEEDERADFVIRNFTLKAKGDRERRVQQYHYMAWPDHGVPAASSLVDFWHYVTGRATTKVPPVIHCSAGVGRTGTYIALNIAIDRKSHDVDINVKDLVTELREQRSIMVQTEVQYRFLHEVILEAYTSRNTRMPMEQLDVMFPSVIDVNKPNKLIDKEFKLLKEMKQWARPNHTIAKQEENMDKNRDPGVLPDDNHLVYLNTYMKGRSQYINAFFLSSFRQRRGLLLTQLPLPDTLPDLWRLVDSYHVNTIVSLGGQKDATTVQEDSHPVTVLHYTDWSGQLPGNTADVLHLVDTLNSVTEGSTAPVIIQCLNGASKSGLFCVLYDIITRMTCDEEVNVFTTVRHVHSITPYTVTSKNEYRYCYRMAQEFKQKDKIYVNV